MGDGVDGYSSVTVHTKDPDVSELSCLTVDSELGSNTFRVYL